METELETGPIQGATCHLYSPTWPGARLPEGPSLSLLYLPHPPE